MKKTSYLFFLILFVLQVACSQAPVDRPEVLNQKFDQMLSQTIGFTVPLIGVEELKTMGTEVTIFDAREKKEYDVSHIEGAKYLGYDDFDVERLDAIPKDRTIIVYCSVGYRSEKIGERLQQLGYQKVYNLYGSLFEWVNRGNPVVDKDGHVTKKIHTYSWFWSRWVDGDQVEKVW